MRGPWHTLPLEGAVMDITGLSTSGDKEQGYRKIWEAPGFCNYCHHQRQTVDRGNFQLGKSKARFYLNAGRTVMERAEARRDKVAPAQPTALDPKFPEPGHLSCLRYPGYLFMTCPQNQTTKWWPHMAAKHILFGFACRTNFWWNLKKSNGQQLQGIL